MISRFLLSLILCAGCVFPFYSAEIDTLDVHSDKMNRNIDVLVIVPEKAKKESCPVLYLLHGYGGNANTWININPDIIKMSDRDGIIVVCPNGENSWYWDSPMNPQSQFETFVAKELLSCIDQKYNTIKKREARAITGLSMGGHGALWLAIRHKDIYGAAGSTSGGVDIRPFPDSWEMKKQIGAKEHNAKRWEEYTVINLLDKIENNELSIIIDCGTDDFFYDVNNKFHNELMKRGVNHDFIVRPGSHNKTYWRNSIEYQWLFFDKFFKGYR